MLRVQPVVVLPHDAVESRRVLDEAVLLVHADRRDRRGAADGVAAVGQAAVEHLRLELLGDLAAHRHRAQRQV